MANEQNLKLFEKGNKMGKGRPKKSQNRSTVVKKWLKQEVKVTNPYTGEEEFLTVEDIITLGVIKKANRGDVAAYKELMLNLYGKPTETLDINADAPKIDFSKIFNFTDESGSL